MEATYPNPNAWRAIQGGEPLVVSNRARTMFEIAHVYNPETPMADILGDRSLPSYREELATKLAHYGCIIDTPRNQFIDSCKRQTGLMVEKIGGVVMPAVMLIDRHGKPCSSASSAGGYERGYKKAQSQEQWRSYLEKIGEEEWSLWGIVKNDETSSRIKNFGLVRSFL